MAREYHWLKVDRTDIYLPATPTTMARLLPKQGVHRNTFLCGLDVKDAFLMVVQPSTAWAVEWATTLVKPFRGLRHGFRKSLVERRVLQRRRRLSAFGLFLCVSTYLCISIYPLFRAANLLYVSYDRMPKLVFVK